MSGHNNYNGWTKGGPPMFMYIYKITNLLNGKVYVGKHTCKNIENIYYGSGVAIKAAIRKYGKENFKKDVLCICKSEGELNKMEIKWILKLGSFGDGYNMTKGGEGMLGRKPTSREIEKARESRVAFYKDNPQAREKLSNLAKKRVGNKNSFYGKSLTREHIEKMTKARVKAISGDKNPSATKVRCKEGGVVYSTAKEAALSVGLKHSTTILKAAKGERKSAGGFTWELL
jgi:group I intron endonuclease